MSKDLDVEGMTRGDFEQLFEDHTTRIVETVEQHRSETQKGFQEAREDRDDLRQRINAVDKRTDEDITATMSGTSKLEKTVAELVRVVEKTTGEKISI